MARQRLRAVKDGAEAGDEAPGLTIDELAQATGMTVRNVRAHQSRGLLPPPEVRARTGYYGDEHVARLRLIQDMQADGFNLGSIRRLLDQDQVGAQAMLGFRQALTAPFGTEEPELLTAEELQERFGEAADPKALEKAQRLGMLVPVGGGRFEAPSPTLMRAAEEVMRRGVSLPAALRVVETLKRHSESVARSFVKLFMEEVWKPFEEAGHPEEGWPQVIESLDRLRPLASETLLAVFQQTMTREVEGAFGKQLERRAKKGR